MDPDVHNLGHLDALRLFVSDLIEQAERSDARVCDCHRPPSLLLVGPPGAGKTYLVKQMSKVCEIPLFGIHTHMASALSIKDLFERAREHSPSLVFLDDIDAIFANHDMDSPCSPPIRSVREEVFAQLGARKLKLFDPNSENNPTRHLLSVNSNPPGWNIGSSRSSSHSSTLLRPLHPSAPPDENSDVVSDDDSLFPDNNGLIVVASTSCPWLLYKDHELLSRFRGVYLVGLPEKQARYHILKTRFDSFHHQLTDEEIMVVAEKTEGFSPADLISICQEVLAMQLQFPLVELRASGQSSSEMASTSSQTPPSSIMSETGSDCDLEYRDVTTSSKSKRECETKKIGQGSAYKVKAAAVAAGASTAGATALATSAAVHSTSQPRKLPVVASKTDNASNASHKVEAYNKTRSECLKDASVLTAATTLTVLDNDWTSDTEEEKSCQNVGPNETKTPARTTASSAASHSNEPELCVSSPDSAIGLLKSIEDASLKTDTKHLSALDSPLESCSSGVASSNCGSSDSSGNFEEDTSFVEEPILESKVSDSGYDSAASKGKTCEVSCKCSDFSGNRVAMQKKVKSNCVENNELGKDSGSRVGDCNKFSKFSNQNTAACDSERALLKSNQNESSIGFELYYSEPPEPVQNDNTAVDSDSEGEAVASQSRLRRVAFLGLNSMEPLTVDVGDNDMPPNISLADLPPNIAVGSSSASEPRLADHHQGSTSAAILRSLLSEPSSINNDQNILQGSHIDIGQLLGSCSSARSSGSGHCSSPLNNCSDLLNLSGGLGNLRLERNSIMNHSTLVSDLASFLCSRRDANKTSTPTEPSEDLTSAPTPNLTPTPSEADSSGSGTHASAVSNASEGTKKEDSDSSFGNSGGHTVPSSGSSSTTCNETGETLECRTDSEEQLRGLEDAHEHQNSGQTSDTDTTTGDDSSDGQTHALLSLNEFVEFHPKITLALVLDVVSKAYRTVGNDDIKKYTDFMVWFGRVAKSACPHSSSVSGPGKSSSSSFDEISIDSTATCRTTTSVRKRRRPLRKLGRFLLKALMFILD